MGNEFKPLTTYWYNVGDVVNGLEVIEQTYAVGKNGWRYKAYIVKCLKCGYIYEEPKLESNLKKFGCKVCRGRKVVEGINDIATTHPWMIKYFKNPEEAKHITYNSNKKTDMLCPDCKKFEKKMSPNILYRNGIGCSFCNDGISYPEKFIANFLYELNIDFITQLSKTNFKWCDCYRYDFYIPDYNIIIEVHGIQHYEDSFVGINSKNRKIKTLKEEQQNDKIKQELALKNGIKNYIILDCRESTLEWIKNSIINSNLQEIFDVNFDNINWDKIAFNSLKSNVLIACKLWNENEYFTTEDIGKILHLSSSTILKYLKKGNEAGFCVYNATIGKHRRDLKKIGKVALNAKKVFYNEIIYDSIKIFSKSINKKEAVVGRWLNGTALPRYEKDKKYLKAHYATEEEIKKYPKYKLND